MTKSEYFEKNNVSFAEAMKLFNEQKSKGTESFDKFLAAEYNEYTFKIGDLIVLQLNEETRLKGWKHNVVFKVIGHDCDDYIVVYVTPGGWEFDGEIGYERTLPIHFAEDNCVLYRFSPKVGSRLFGAGLFFAVIPSFQKSGILI